MMSFKNAVQGDELAISAELALERESSAGDIARQADLYRDRVDGIQVSDSQVAWVGMSALAASSLLIQNDVDPVPILACRDRNRVALQSDLLGYRALGVTSMLLTRGRRVGQKHALHGSTVFDLTGMELIAMGAGLNEEGDLLHGEDFFIGTGVKTHRAKRGWAAESLNARADAGAQFLQTQVCYNLDVLRHWMERLVEAQVTWRYSVVISLAVMDSARTARWIKEKMSDSLIPDPLIDRLEQAGDPEHEGVQLCAETLQELAGIPGISGVNLISVGNPELNVAAIDASGLREASAG